MSRLRVDAKGPKARKRKTPKQFIKETAFLGDWESMDTEIQTHPDFMYKVPYCRGNHRRTFVSNREARNRLIQTDVAEPKQYLPTELDEETVKNVKFVEIRYRKEIGDSFKHVVDLYFYARSHSIEPEIYGRQKHFVLVVSRLRPENGVRLFALTMFNTPVDDGTVTNEVYDETTKKFYPVNRYVFDAVRFKWKPYDEEYLYEETTEFVHHES